MSKRNTKYTYEEVKEFIETNSNCKLLSTEYIGANDKLLLLCLCGNEFAISFNKFRTQNKIRCNKCSINMTKDKLSLKFENVVEIYKEKGLKILSDSYINNKTKIDCEDNDGYKYSLSLDALRLGNNFSRFNKLNPFTIYNIRKYLKDNNIECELVSLEYSDAVKNNLIFRCKCGNVYNTSWSVMSNKRRRKTECDVCVKDKLSKETRLPIQEVIEILNNNGYKMINNEYKRASDKIRCIDSEGYRYLVRISALKNGVKPSRFCNGNIYTAHNIGLFLSKNNVNSKIISDSVSSSDQPIKMICDCGNEYIATWARLSVFSQIKCEKCRVGMPYDIYSAKKTFEENGYLLLDETYINNATPMKCKDIDGYKYMTTLATVKTSNKLLRYTKTNPFTIYNIKKHLELSKSGTEYVGELFTNVNQSLTFKCGKCGDLFKRSINSLVDNNRYYCKSCSREDAVEKTRFGIDNAKNKANEVGLIPLFDKYVSNSQKLKCMTNDGYIVTPSLNNLMSNKIPEIVSKSNDYSLDNIQTYLDKMKSGCTVVSDKYIGNNLKLEFVCNCGTHFKRTWASLYSRNAFECPKCIAARVSSYETKVLSYLTENNILFEPQYRFKGCKDKHQLPFDFYLPEMKICIECQGRQHYEPVEYFGGVKAFNSTVKHDDIKHNYCLINNINLIVLPYWEFDNNEWVTIIESYINNCNTKCNDSKIEKISEL